MAHPDEPQRALTQPAADADATGGRLLARGVALFVAALALTLVAYLYATVPGPWFPSASDKTWTAEDLRPVRGTATRNGQEWVVQAPDAAAFVVLSATASLRASEYRVVSVSAVGFPTGAEVSLLWQNDVQPGELHQSRLRIESGRARPLVVAGDAAWVGRITGVALAMKGPLVEPVRVRGVVASPMGVAQVLRARLGEWLAFEGWTGTSINTIVGGADVQDFPMPWMLAIAITLAVLLAMGLGWRRIGPARSAAAGLAACAIVASFLLDTRWTLALVRQSAITGATYGGKDNAARHAAAEDGELYAFVQQARKLMPDAPVRVFVAAEAHYFRGRAAYHLYPENVYFDPRSDTVAPASAMHAGDWLLVYRRPGIQYDRALQTLRWDGGQTHKAELKLVAPGAALFRLL